MLVQLTTTNLGIHLVEVHDIIKIVEDAGTLAVVVQMDNTTKIEPSETLDEIFAQQDTDERDLNMILVTNVRTGNREIHFTHRILRITGEVGGGSKIIFKNSKEPLAVVETMANILAYQTAAINIGIVSATDTTNGQSKQILFMDHDIDRVISSDPTNPASTAIIYTKKLKSAHPVAETVAVIFA